MNLFALSGFLTGITSSSIGLFVYLKQRQNPLSKVWGIFTLSVAIWGFGCYKMASVTDETAAFLWYRLAHIGTLLIPVFIYHFVYLFLGLTKRIILKMIYAIGSVFVIANIFDLFRSYFFHASKHYLIIAHMKWIFDSFYMDTPPGLIYPYFVAFFFTVVGVIYYQLIRSLKESTGNRRQQIKYFLVACVIGFIGGGTSFLPVFGINVYPIGNFATAIYPLIIAYAIFAYRLMDIEVIIKKTLVFAGIVAAAVSVITFPFALIQAVIGKALGVPDPFFLMALGIATTVLVYRPVERVLVNITDKYLFQKKINYRLLLREASEYLAHVDSLKQQARNIVAFLLKKARIANVSVYAFAAPDRSTLLLKASRPLITDENLKRISLSHPIVEYFSRHQGPMEINALKESKEGNAEKTLPPRELDELLDLMKSLQAEAAIPCFGGEAASKFDKRSTRLKGILFLGHQKSDEPYSDEDLDVFFTLGQESSIAFENARLYDEAINRSIELQKMNEELEQTNVTLKETHAALLEEKKRAVLAGLGKAMAHEIRNPITPINSHLYFGRKRLEEMKKIYEASLSEPTEDNRQKFLGKFNSAMELLSEIEKSKDRIQGIVNTLYNLVAQKTGDKVEVKLDMVVESAIEEVKYQTYWETLSQPDIENRIPRQLPFALGIPQDIQGVFVNLIVNALHALEKTVDKKITIDGMVDPDNPDVIKIEFSDNGCGMTEEVLKKCFEHGFTTKGGKGTGLGLFYCKNIIEQAHGGTMSVKNKVGEGTCFTIRLPRYKKEALERRT